MNRPEPPPSAGPADSFGVGQWKPRRKGWVLGVLLGILATLVLGVWWLALRPKPKGNRLLVLIRTENRDGTVGAWWATGGRASGRCADKLDDALSGLGMDVVKAGDAKTVDALEGRSGEVELRKAARGLEAGLVLSGTLRVVEARELGGSDGQKDFGLNLELELASSDDSAGTRLAPGDDPLRVHVPAADEPAALLGACEQLPATIVPLVALHLREVPQVKALLEREPRGRGLDDTVVVERLRPLFELGQRHAEAARLRSEAEQQLRDRDAKQERGELRKQLLGDFLGEEYWVGDGPGSDLVLMRLPYRPTLPDASAERYELRPEHEQLVRASADGKARRTLLEVFNIFSYPSVSADGGSVALVLDQRQWSKALGVASVADGTVRELVVHRSHYFSSPTISPDGRRVVFWSSPNRDADKSLEVIGTDGSDRRVLVPAPWARMDQPAWSPDSRSIVLSLKGLDERTASVWRIDVSTGERTLLLGTPARAAAAPRAGAPVELPSSFLRPTVAPDGSFVAVVEETAQGMWLGRFELVDQHYQRLAQGPAGRLSISPDSRRIALETAPTTDPDDPAKEDLEIALVAATGGAARLLTRNDIDDSLAGWSRDGRRLYFHQTGADPDGKHRDNRIYWVEP